jgi:NitT/TauT family transport system ATP-binding protein
MQPGTAACADRAEGADAPLLVEASGIQVQFGPLSALRDLNLQIRRGEFVSLVGPSGCGKSTVLRLLAGLLPRTAGEIRVAGAEPSVARRHQLRVSFVFQDATLLPWRRVAANVSLPLEVAGVSREERARRALEALTRVGLADFARYYPQQLSGGMRMRAALARALCNSPELLLLDEPFAALDDLTRRQLNEELLALWLRDRWTGVFVTHNIAEAVFLSTRVLVLTPRPARVAAEFHIGLPLPRSDELRGEPEFARLVGAVSRALRACVQPPYGSDQRPT